MSGERAHVCRGFYLSPELDPFARPELEPKQDAEEDDAA
jgi:hypothetical protein